MNPMKEIEFTDDHIMFREEVEVFGERNVEELKINHAEREEYELELDTGGHVPLETLLDVRDEAENGSGSLVFRLEELPSVKAEVRRRSSDERDGIPPVPDVDLSDVDVGGRRSFYRRMRSSPDSQPAKIRELIYNHQELDRDEFDRRVDEELGYAANGGGVNMSLVVLEDLTEEIEREGQAEDQTIRWIDS